MKHTKCLMNVDPQKASHRVVNQLSKEHLMSNTRDVSAVQVSKGLKDKHQLTPLPGTEFPSLFTRRLVGYSESLSH